MKHKQAAYSLKVADTGDFKDVKRMCLQFHAASVYADKKCDEEKVNSLVHEYLLSPTDRIIILGVLEGKPCGLIAGATASVIFNDEKMVTETIWWVDEEHRGSRLGLQLIGAFEYWGREIQKASYVQMSGLADTPKLDKVYEKLGYKMTEKAFIKEWQQ